MPQTIEKPTERQLSYLTDLVRDRVASIDGDAPSDLARLTRWLAKPRSRKEVSEMIDRMRAKPRRTAAGHPAASPLTRPRPAPVQWAGPVPESVTDSKYAVYSGVLASLPEPWARQEICFFEVKKLRGRRQIRRLLGAPGGFSRSLVPAALADELYEKLADQDFALSASTLFGRVYQCCGTCGAELTDEVSRELHQGPICRKRWARIAHR